MLNLLIISGVLVGCASEESSFDSFSDDPTLTAGNLRAPVMMEFPVVVTDGTEGYVEVAAYKYGENGIEIGKTLSVAQVEGGKAMVGIPKNAPKRDLGTSPDELSLYAIVLHGEENNIVGISDANLVFSQVFTAERAIGWNLGFDLGGATEHFKSIHSNAEVSANLTGTDKIQINVVSEVESAEDQHLGIVTYTDQLYSLWDAHIETNMSVALEGAPFATTFGSEVDGMPIHQSIGVAYRDSNINGRFDMDEPVDGLFCRDGANLNVTFIPEVYEIDEAMNMAEQGLRTGWSVTQWTTNSLDSFPADAELNLTIQSACTLPD